MKSFFSAIMCFFVLFITPKLATAQQQTKPDYKKVVVVKKSIVNGKLTESRQEAEGKAAEELINSMSVDEIENVNIDKRNNGDNTITITKKTISDKAHNDADNVNIEITSEKKDGKLEERYKLIKKTQDGEQVIEWDGKGDMPEDMKKVMGHTIVHKKMDGNTMEIKVDTDGDGHTKKDKEVIIVHGEPKGKGSKEMAFLRGDTDFVRTHEGMKSESANTNKASLGVQIDDTDDGVIIKDIEEGSAAAKAGLRRGDVILKINNKYIFTSKGLIQALRPFNPNESIKVKYIRDGKEMSANATLKAR
jgi:hypothetical protein